jgi:hypothetical protein
MNQLENGAAWLSQQLDQFASVEITYQRGNQSLTFPATKGRTSFEQVDANNVIAIIESRDFIVTAGRLVFAGQATNPNAGDRIIETRNGVQSIYEVNAFGNQQPFRQCDPYGIKLRVHSKLISESPV